VIGVRASGVVPNAPSPFSLFSFYRITLLLCTSFSFFLPFFFAQSASLSFFTFTFLLFTFPHGWTFPSAEGSLKR
jgi:hypothetical protein